MTQDMKKEPILVMVKIKVKLKVKVAFYPRKIPGAHFC
jgi:hypothetical protein